MIDRAAHRAVRIAGAKAKARPWDLDRKKKAVDP
jgi:hypothetical protein